MPNIEIPDVIKSASDAAQDNLPATMEQTDGALSTVVGFFNNVVLYPVKKANLTFRYKLESFEDDLKKKTKAEARETALELLRRVGLEDKANEYPSFCIEHYL